MKYRKVSLVQLFLAFLMYALLVCTLSCSHDEKVDSYLDSLVMAPPIDEPLFFEIAGHRGYGSAAPENTLAALRRSIEEGVEIAEVDIRLTSDGIPVLLHDESLLRTTGNPHLVQELTLAEVEKLDAGSSNSIEFKGEQIPTLEEALLLARGKLKMLLHMKLPHSGPVIAATVRKTHFPVTDTLIMSDEFDTIVQMKRLVPGASMVHLSYELPVGPIAQQAYIEKQKRVGATRAALDLDEPDEDYMAMAKNVGLRILLWTADRPYDSAEVNRFTADGVITNKPLMWIDWAARIRQEKRS
jgi:glycerophosphoryl diester phosphodiesterase